MEAVFEAKMIGPESLRQAYAVALLNAPSLEFAEFRRRMASAKNGALSGIFDRRGYIHAVFRSRVEERVDGGRSLAVFDFLVTDSLSHSLASQMVESLLKRAGEFGCDQMTFLSPSQQKNGFSFLELLEKLGFSGESVMMARKL